MVRPAEVWANPWQRRGLIALIIITLYGAAGFLLAPWLIERTLTGTLAERLALQTRIGNLSLNPFSLSLKVDDLAITEADGQQLLAFERLYVNFQLSSLFRWAWSFDEIHLIRPAVHLERLTESELNLTELAARWEATAEPQPSAAATEAAEAEVEAPVTAIPRLMIADLRIVEGGVTVVDRAVGEPFDTELTPINLELSGFSTLPDRSGQQQVSIRTESGAEIALGGSLSVNPLALDGQVRLEGTYTPMLFRYFRDQLALPLTFDGGDLSATFDYRIAMDDSGELNAVLSNMDAALTGLNINQPDHPHLVELGELGLSGGSLIWPDQSVSIERVTVDDLLVRLFRAEDGSYLPGLAGPTTDEEEPAPAEEPSASEEPSAAEETGMEAIAEDAEEWRVEVGEIAVSRARVTHTDTTLEDGSLEISDLQLSLRDLSLADNQLMPLTLNVMLSPGGIMALNGQVQMFPDFQLTSSITITELALAAAQPYLNSVANIAIADGNLSLEGDLSAGGDQAFGYDGNLEVASLSLIDRAQEEGLFSWQLLSVDRLRAAPDGIELSILSVDAPYARIEIERDGSTNIERTFVPESTETIDVETTTTEPNSVETGGGMALTIGETRVSGGSAHFTDLALPLPFSADITNLQGTLSTFATTSNAPSEIDLTGQVNEYGALKIDGNISANEITAATDVRVDFDNVNLPRMTPYTIKFAGRAIADGRTDLTLTYRLEDGELDGNNRLVIRDLTLGEKVEQPGAMDLPLDMAVALLKDGEGNVDFSFPVSGSIDDPEFSYSGAVMKAMSNVIGGIVAAPFKLLGSLVGMAPEELEHIGFEPGVATITPPQRETLAKLAEALGQRPQLILEVAPVQNATADRHAIAERMLDAEIDSALEQSLDDEQSHTEALRSILESLYDATALAARDEIAARDSIAAAHTTSDEAGAPVLDVPAYNLALREALIAARDVPDVDLNALALSRLDTIHEALNALIPLPDERLQALPMEEVELNVDGLVQMSLNVTIAD